MAASVSALEVSQRLGLSIAGKVAQGIIAGTPLAAAASAKMAQSVLTGTSRLTAGGAAAGIGSSLAASALGPASGGGASGGTTIVVDVHGNYVLSDSDTAKLAAAIGKQLATVTLPGAGHVISMH